MSCTATVRVTLEVAFALEQPWSSEETVGNMQKRAHRDAHDMAKRMALTVCSRENGAPISAKLVSTGAVVTMVLPEPGK